MHPGFFSASETADFSRQRRIFALSNSKQFFVPMNYVIASYLNLLCYLLLGASHYLGYTSLMHVALLAALVSFYFTVKMLRFYRRHKSEAPQGMPFRIGFSFFCIAFFVVYYAMKVTATAPA